MDGNSSVLSSRYYPPIILEDYNYALGLESLVTWNSFPNIDSNNNKFYFFTPDKKEHYIEIPEGSYEIEDIESYLNKEIKNYMEHYFQYEIDKHGNRIKKFKMLTPSLIIRGNNNTLKSEVKCTLDINFSRKDSLGNLLGFKDTILKAHKTHISDFPAKILKVNALCVYCNIVTGSYKNGSPVHVIHQFFPTVPPGYKIVERPLNVIYLPINTKQIDEIIVKITDQEGNIVSFRGEEVGVRLHLKKVT